MAPKQVNREKPALANNMIEPRTFVLPQKRAPAAAPASKEHQRASKRARSNGTVPPASATPTAAAVASPPAPAGQQFFLMKSEPDVFSIDDLQAKPGQTEGWDGVRSHQAKKVLQSMRLGDQAFFYHSNAKPPGIVGIVTIVEEAHPDPTQFDRSSNYYDPSASKEAPKWVQVECRLVRKLDRQITLEELKGHKEGALASMALFKYGRLSVQPVTPAEWQFVLGLEGQAPPGAGEAAAGAAAEGGRKAGSMKKKG